MIPEPRSNACCKCGEIGHFHRDCVTFGSPSQSGDNTNTVKDQMTHTVTANSPIMDMVPKSLVKKVMSTKVAKKSYKIPASYGKCDISCCHSCDNRDTVVTNVTFAIPAATASSVLKEHKKLHQ